MTSACMLLAGWAVCMLLTACHPAPIESVAPPEPVAALFVERSGYAHQIYIHINEDIVPIAVLQNGKLLAYGDESLDAKPGFDELKPGLELNSYSAGGHEVISLGMKKLDGCQGSATPTIVAVGPYGHGVLTNFRLGSTQAASRFEEVDEKGYLIANRLAAATLRRHHVKAKYISQMAIRRMPGSVESSTRPNLLAIQSKGSAYPLLIAAIDLAELDHNLTMALSFVAEADADGRYKITYEAFKRGTAGEDYANALQAIASIDLDGDGMDELFFFEALYESARYFLLQKRNGRWKQAATYNGSGC